VFSPYYAWARQRGPRSAYAHCALNAVLYGPRGGKRWAMTERGQAALSQAPAALAIGPSALAWDRATLTVTLDELAVPWPRRLRGVVRLHAGALTGHVATLDAAGGHRWSPLAPCGQVEVALTRPALRWTGSGYLDSNWGDGPLERAFARWHWCRASLPDGTAILYDIERRAGGRRALALAVDRAGTVRDMVPPPVAALPPTRWWRMARAIRAEAGGRARVVRTLEDTPFYARSVVSTRLLGQEVTAWHESLSLERFRQGWVQALLPFRMPRAWR
jgi:carotenoid 1,2-hydratase